MTLVLVLAACFLVGVLVAEYITKRGDDSMRWRVVAEGTRFFIWRPYKKQYLRDYGGLNRRLWKFDPTDHDSRADALVAAQDYCDGLNIAQQQVKELNR